MPKVMIDGMKMPKSCQECPLNENDEMHDYCAVTDSLTTFGKENRPCWCPLQEVKE